MTPSGPLKWALRTLRLQTASESGEKKKRIYIREKNTGIESKMMLFEL